MRFGCAIRVWKDKDCVDYNGKSTQKGRLKSAFYKGRLKTFIIRFE